MHLSMVCYRIAGWGWGGGNARGFDIFRFLNVPILAPPLRVKSIKIPIQVELRKVKIPVGCPQQPNPSPHTPPPHPGANH